jgi:uncharacterized protein (DUF1697 family)
VATFIALLRAVNVGGTGKLPMSELRALCERLGFRNVRRSSKLLTQKWGLLAINTVSKLAQMAASEG